MFSIFIVSYEEFFGFVLKRILFSAYTQQIIINSSEELLKDPFLPLAERVKKRTETLYHKEESLRGFIKSSTDDTSQVRDNKRLENYEIFYT